MNLIAPSRPLDCSRAKRDHPARVALVLLLFAAAPAHVPSFAGERSEDGSKDLLQALARSSVEARPAIVRELIRLGASGLDATRSARDSARDPDLKSTLARIATWQLAHKITPALLERFETHLQFDGQYEALNQEGPEVVAALLVLINDDALFIDDGSDKHFKVRFASCQALADVGDESIIPALRTMYHDPLLHPELTERVGLLMAIFGDTYAVEQEIARLEDLVAQSQAMDPGYLPRNMRLAELYYKIRDYTKAVGCYDRILLVYREHYRRVSGQPGVPGDIIRALKREYALQYYNAACSQTLKGDLDRAKELLRNCIRFDPSHYENIRRDGDFRKLRESQGFGEFFRELSRLLPPESL